MDKRRGSRERFHTLTAPMELPRRRLLPSLLGGIGIGVAALALPADAQAHGIVGKADLPIPVWLFSWAAAIVLVVSFVALSTMWTKPQLQEQHLRRLFRLAPPLEWLAALVGVGLFALVIYSGFDGAQVTQANFSVTFIYVVFWVGMPVASVAFGDVFKRILAVAHLRPGHVGAGAPSAPRQARLAAAALPAMAGDVACGGRHRRLCLAGADLRRTRPPVAAGGAFAGLLPGDGCGHGAVRRGGVGGQADGFGAYFSLVSKLSALVRCDDGWVYLRRPLSGITSLQIRAGTVALICTLIGTTTFDGFSNGGIWRTNEPHLQSLFSDLGLHQTPSLELAYSVGLLFCLALVAAVYRIGIIGVHSVSDRYDVHQLTRTFAHTLVPIGFAYVVAHYFSLLLWQSQAIGYLISDPLGNGANLFGTSGFQIDYHVISYAGIWYVQVAALVSGHVGGLALAHDRALVRYSDPEEAVRSQYWMLAVMVAFTSFGLWLLSSVGT